MTQYTPWMVVQGEEYESCQAQQLGSGILIGKVVPHLVSFVGRVTFNSYCVHGYPVYNAVKFNKELFHYPLLQEQNWQKFISTGSQEEQNGSFPYGIYPVILSFTANFVMTVFLTLLSFINIKGKRHRHAARLLKIGSTIASVNIVIFVTCSLKQLHNEHEENGVTTTGGIMDLFYERLVYSILDLISFFLLQLCQVMIVTRLFYRDSEKRMTFFLGVLLVLAANILWSIPQFATSDEEQQDRWEILAPFVYLLRIAVAASYASTIISYGILKRRYCLASSQMVILSVITALVVLLQPALFLADVSNVWLSGVGELFNSTCYVGSTSIVWEWLERLSVVRKKEEAQSILGRPIYEDEQGDYRIANYALRVQHALTQRTPNNTDSDNGVELEQMSPSSQVGTSTRDTGSSCAVVPQNSTERESVYQVNFKQKQPFAEAAKQKMSHACDTLLYFADQVILKSLGTLSMGSKKSITSANREALVRKRIGLDRPNEVYVYSTKDVNFDSDRDEDDTQST